MLIVVAPVELEVQGTLKAKGTKSSFRNNRQGVTANIRPPIFRKKIENYKKYANFKGEIRFPCEIQL